MNIKEYIESGIVGSYVLGLATEAERKEFESLCSEYPELIRAKESFERALEAQLIEEAVAPPEGLKEEILRSLNTPGRNALRKEMDANRPLRKINVWKRLAVAFIILSGGSIYFSYHLNEKYQKALIENTALKKGLDYSGHTNTIREIAPIVQRPSVKWSTMVEPGNPSHCMAHIYWDSLSTNTFLLIGNIPRPVSDKQFQLWAVLDNHPINLGTFDIKKEGQFIQMRDLNKAKTFIITIEQKGGSPAPTRDSTYAIGNL